LQNRRQPRNRYGSDAAFVFNSVHFKGLRYFSNRTLTAHIQTLAPKLSRELPRSRGPAVAQKSGAARQLGDAPIASRSADYRQKPRLGSRGEDFPLVNRLPALPATAQ
jgi:hypothetical protein